MNEETATVGPCIICDSWGKRSKFSEHDLFELVTVTDTYKSLMEWLKELTELGAYVQSGTVAICEVHFMKDDIVREYDEKGLPILRLAHDLVSPAFLTYREVIFFFNFRF